MNHKEEENRIRQGKPSDHKVDPILVKGKKGRKKNWTKRSLKGMQCRSHEVLTSLPGCSRAKTVCQKSPSLAEVSRPLTPPEAQSLARR